ncbi:SlyX family protein [Oceanobacter mangrovi]|uniref:SlyX family protein n=1 Tax=Oceanobacter mangrovi TaxID=2862510 RepID=UPI001C8D2C45|nr:SlyX family protein [Oceanobacter mangrovi]
MTDKQTPRTDNDNSARIAELEIRIAYMDETIDALNQQVSRLTLDFETAREAMKMMNQRIEQLMQSQGPGKSPADDAPPPHY